MLLACGGEHVVYRYGEHEVIKFSLFELFATYETAVTKALHDVALCSEIFGPYFLTTRIGNLPSRKRIAKIQEKISGRPLRLSDMHDDHLRQQFEDFVRRYESLISHGETLDLVGGQGLLTGRLNNLFVTSDGRLLLIDALLVSIPNQEGNQLLRWMSQVLSAQQGKIINRYLGA